jgi:DNA invertase Pin-like site-specific DNA recombinase
MQQPEHLLREGDRREHLRMLDRLAPGEVVTVTRIDRLARSTFDLFGIVKHIVDEGTIPLASCRESGQRSLAYLRFA